jgi:hypothetical protein
MAYSDRKKDAATGQFGISGLHIVELHYLYRSPTVMEGMMGWARRTDGDTRNSRRTVTRKLVGRQNEIAGCH